MNHTVKQVLVRIGAFVLALAVVLIPAAYYFALFDFTFIRRPASWPQSPDYILSLLSGNDNEPDGTATADPTSGVTTADPTVSVTADKTADATGTADKTADATATADKTADPAPTSEQFSPEKADVLISSGRRMTDREYDGTMRLAVLATEVTPDARLSISKKTADVLTYEKEREDGLPHAVYTKSEADRLTVEVCMGYALTDTGDGIAVCGIDGGRLAVLCRYGYGEYEPAFTRDKDGRPLFVKCGTDGTETEYFYIDGGTMAKSDYDDEADGRRLYFDYPAYYGESEYSDGVKFISQTVAYRGDSSMPIEACCLLSEDGYITYSSLTEGYLSDDRYMISSMRAPVSFGAESIGSFYLDHGYMMARTVRIDWYMFTAGYLYEKVYSDVNTVIDRTGKAVEIPFGYEVKAYSSGMILLEKDGRYGYMDTDGAWVVQPSLTYAEPFYCGLASVGYGDGTRAMIGTDGSAVIPAGQFDYISHSSSGLIAAHSADGWTMFAVMEQK